MPITKGKKREKYRGSKTHGGGSMKKRRGSGNRGGFGMAGSGKRADQKKQSILKEFGNSYFGKHGFNRPQKLVKKVKSININTIEKNLTKLKAKEEAGVISINLTGLKYNKLLSKGNTSKKYKITVASATTNAQEKIKKAGGEVILPK